MEQLIAPVFDFVCPSSQVSNPEWISHLHSYLLEVIPKVTSGVTPAFFTNRGVHCMSVYTAWQASHFDPCTCNRQMYPKALVLFQTCSDWRTPCPEYFKTCSDLRTKKG